MENTNTNTNTYQRLAKKCDEAARKKWLMQELERVGCTLQDDSALCEAHIRDSCGHPRDIADSIADMKEMKFYLEETEYTSIKNNNNNTDESTKKEALQRWLSSFASKDSKDSEEETCKTHKSLPFTLKEMLLIQIKDARSKYIQTADAKFKAWTFANKWNSKVLEEMNKLKEHDKIWKCICKYMKWQYNGSI